MRALSCAIALASVLAPGPAAASEWWDSGFGCRVPVDVGAGGCERRDKPVDVGIDFGALLTQLGKPTPVIENSIRVVEVDAGGSVVDQSVPFQYDASTKTVTFVMEGTTGSSATRHYHLYFDSEGSFNAPSVIELVTLEEDFTDDSDSTGNNQPGMHEGQLSYRIRTRDPSGGQVNTTYYYHKDGAGFASIEDRQGNDWIGYKPSGNQQGNYRGIPNAVHGDTESLFHPGAPDGVSSIRTRGPVKVTIYSRSKLDRWRCTWDIYPRYARLTVLRHGAKYWFLYEGTPGGYHEVHGDFCVRSGNTQTDCSESWTGDIAGPEWLYFADGGLTRSLFLVHEDDDTETDSYWPMGPNHPQVGDGGMTVFGFGRSGLNKYMAADNNHFTIGFAESKTYSTVGKDINSAYRALSVSLGAPESATGATRADCDRKIRDHRDSGLEESSVLQTIKRYREQ